MKNFPAWICTTIFAFDKTFVNKIKMLSLKKGNIYGAGEQYTISGFDFINSLINDNIFFVAIETFAKSNLL